MLINSKIAFCLGLLCTLFGPALFPTIHLFYLTPYLVISLYVHSRFSTLWRALACGIILDLLSSHPFFGISSLQLCLSCFLLQTQTRNFFEDRLFTLPIMTYLFSFLSTLFSCALDFFIGKSLLFSWKWIATDLICMPFADSIYALLVFSLPLQVISKLRLKPT